MKTKAAFIFTAAVLIAGMLFLSVSAYHGANEFECINKEIAQKSQMTDKIFGIFNLGNSKKVRELTEMAEDIKNRTMIDTALFFGLCAVFIGLAAYVKAPEVMCGALLITAFISLVVGLAAPIISIVIYKDIPFIGHAIIQFESKGIISSVDSLWAAGHYVISSVIFIFSIVVPIAKTAAMGFIVMLPYAPASKKLIRVFNAIGKWSMTDVFVVALIISVFSFSSGKSTNAAPQAGLYFFLAFVILSMSVAYKFPQCSSSETCGHDTSSPRT